MKPDAAKPLACPHCGGIDIALTSRLDFDEDYPYDDDDGFRAYICDASYGHSGCGASGGFAPSEAEALERWNRRTPPAGWKLVPIEPKRHNWSRDGETCLDCGDKDWMAGPVCRPTAPENDAPRQEGE